MLAPIPRRSVLYVPASNARALEKARALPADAIVLDLEDGVAPDAKGAARTAAVGAVAALARAVGGPGLAPREVAIRVNHAATPWGADDLTAVARSGAAAAVLPKVESPDEVRAAAAALAAAGAPASLALWAMIETPRGVLAADAIAGAHPRLAVLVAGTSDLVADLRARHVPGRLPVLTSLSLLVLAARAHGLGVLDGVHLDLDDGAGFEAACDQGRDLGFDGKTLIHPRQLEPANRAFAPAAAAVDHARRVLAAHAEALARGSGVAVLDGRLVENLHAEEARRLVALSEAIAARGMG
ncbi:MAG: CoA ester lyase [Anaeromyxobacteraceae bacterium]